jgi:opacity protein-like surface antigen
MHKLLSPVFAAVLLTAVSARPAAADLRATPFAGVTFLDDTSHGTFGASLTAGGLVSVEFDAGRTELGRLAEVSVVDVSAHAATFMGNLVVRMPAGPVQPYVTGGVGIVRVTGSIDVPVLGSLFSVSAQDFGWNVGGGVYIMPTRAIGVRADVRRFQTTDLTWTDITDISGIGSIPLPKFDFWRATGGITFRF